jgi:hypothetical protein
MQEIVAKTQAERNNRDNESHFGEQSAEENSYPVDSWVTHFFTPDKRRNRTGEKRTYFAIFLARALTLAQRLLAAATIFSLPAADNTRFFTCNFAVRRLTQRPCSGTYSVQLMLQFAKLLFELSLFAPNCHKNVHESSAQNLS